MQVFHNDFILIKNYLKQKFFQSSIISTKLKLTTE